MRTIRTNIYRVLQGGKTIFVSLNEIEVSDMDDHYARNIKLPIQIQQETIDIPVVSSKVVMWEALTEQGNEPLPHLHFCCPRCNEVHNVDLDLEETSPLFGCCDSCGWESLVWIEWDKVYKKR